MGAGPAGSTGLRAQGSEHRAQSTEHKSTGHGQGAPSDSPPWRGQGWVYGKGTVHRAQSKWHKARDLKVFGILHEVLWYGVSRQVADDGFFKPYLYILTLVEKIISKRV